MKLALIILFYIGLIINFIYVIRKGKATPEETEQLSQALKEMHKNGLL